MSRTLGLSIVVVTSVGAVLGFADVARGSLFLNKECHCCFREGVVSECVVIEYQQWLSDTLGRL